MSSDCLVHRIDEVRELDADDAGHGADEDAGLADGQVAEVHYFVWIHVRFGYVTHRIDLQNDVENYEEVEECSGEIRYEKYKRANIKRVDRSDRHIFLCGRTDTLGLENWQSR